MKILVTGAKGMLGQDLCPILEDEGFDVIETDSTMLDVKDANQINSVLKKENPDIVIHCAAFTDVDGAEADLISAKLVNEKGTEHIAKFCGEKEILIVYISTDYVFDGTKAGPYLPEDKTNPINNYGKTKLGGEIAVQKYCKKHYIVRTSWLYGHHGKNFVETMISLKDKPELKVVDDQIGCPTWTVDLANGILELIEEEYEHGIYHICGSGKTSWYNFAKEIFNHIGAKVNLIPRKTEESPRPATRPKNSAMDNEGFGRKWELALKDYLDLRSE